MSAVAELSPFDAYPALDPDALLEDSSIFVAEDLEKFVPSPAVAAANAPPCAAATCGNKSGALASWVIDNTGNHTSALGAPASPPLSINSAAAPSSSSAETTAEFNLLDAPPHPACLLPGVGSASCGAGSAAFSSISTSSSRRSLRDQNSVTIKATTVVKDAAGAIDKILSRGVTALVTALRSGPSTSNPGCTSTSTAAAAAAIAASMSMSMSGSGYGSGVHSHSHSHSPSPFDSLNQAVKAIAVARQYARETGPPGMEVTFMPFHRNDSAELPDPTRFGFLVFPVRNLGVQLKTADDTVLNVARGSDVHKMASAIMAVMLDRGQAVMKAAGGEAIFVAMSAVVNARQRLVAKHGFDLMLAAAWITEDTVSTMGRESKFLRFNVLRTEPAGPKGLAPPPLPPGLEALACV